MYQWRLKIACHGRTSWTFQHCVSILCENSQPQRAPGFGLRQRSTERTQLKDVIWKSQQVVAGGALLALHSVRWSLLNKGNQEHCQYLSSTWNDSHPNLYQDTLATDLKAIPTLVVWFRICLDSVKGKVKKLLIGFSHI